VQGFDLTTHIRRVCVDMVARLPELTHIDLRRVVFSFRQTRKSSPWGVQATLTPLRFEGGQLHTLRRGRRYGVQRVLDPQGQEMLYVLCVYLPRFMDHSLREKLVTLLHELWHISPEFNGDLRRHEGRCYAHSHSQREYDASMGVLVDRWLAAGPDPQLYAFLDLNFRQLRDRHGAIYGVRLPQPKLIPLAEAG
jgi:hypothetical protein